MSRNIIQGLIISGIRVLVKQQCYDNDQDSLVKNNTAILLPSDDETDFFIVW